MRGDSSALRSSFRVSVRAYPRTPPAPGAGREGHSHASTFHELWSVRSTENVLAAWQPNSLRNQMPLYAHSSDRPESFWELLGEHLERVGRCAAKFAAKFGAEDWGRAAGQLHDLGKAKPGFQAYIRGQRPSVPHAA